MSFESALAKLRQSFGAYMEDNVFSKVTMDENLGKTGALLPHLKQVQKFSTLACRPGNLTT